MDCGREGRNDRSHRFPPCWTVFEGLTDSEGGNWRASPRPSYVKLSYSLGLSGLIGVSAVRTPFTWVLRLKTLSPLQA